MRAKYYKCDDCGKCKEFESYKKARNAGWAVSKDYKECWCPSCAPNHRRGGANRGVKNMYGCPYCKIDKSYNEYCALTKKPTNGAMRCDCDYESCPEYKNARQPIKPAREPKRSATPQLTQTSLFGAAGEKPFRE